MHVCIPMYVIYAMYVKLNFKFRGFYIYFWDHYEWFEGEKLYQNNYKV